VVHLFAFSQSEEGVRDQAVNKLPIRMAEAYSPVSVLSVRHLPKNLPLYLARDAILHSDFTGNASNVPPV